MGSWTETHSPHFVARHDEVDNRDVVPVLELLEDTRDRLEGVFEHIPEDVAVVLHGSKGQLYAAQPELPVILRLTNPASRRYLTGWPGSREIHLLAPRHLRSRASNVPGSAEMASLSPAALYAQVVVGANNPRLPPPFRPRSFQRMLKWAWLWAGAGQWFGGQTAYARPAIGRRLREGERPRFPPSTADALLLGGSVLDLLAAERSDAAVLSLVLDPDPGDPRRALERAFGGGDLTDIGGRWRAHLAHMAGADLIDPSLRRDRGDRGRDRDLEW